MELSEMRSSAPLAAEWSKVKLTGKHAPYPHVGVYRASMPLQTVLQGYYRSNVNQMIKKQFFIIMIINLLTSCYSAIDKVCCRNVNARAKKA
jgi:hypothetical protein